MAKGTLYGVGVGPGDPKLMTIRAGEVIRAAHVLAYPANASGESRAREIAAPIIEGQALELPVHLPMKVEREPAQSAYHEAAKLISTHLDKGRDVAWLCVGDPMFYGSFMYLAARLGETHAVEIIPGVNSLSACAAQTHLPLGHRNDVFSVIPATLDDAALKLALEHADAAAIIKVGRHFGKVRKVLEELELDKAATVLESVTGADEKVTRLSEVAGDEHSYFSTILIRREAIN